MTFRAYLTNIEKQTGVNPEDMVKQAVKKALTKPGAKSRPAIDWLMTEYKLSNAYALAVIRLMRDKKLLDQPSHRHPRAKTRGPSGTIQSRRGQLGAGGSNLRTIPALE